MSRVAKMPVTIPAGVDVTMNEQHISVKGAGGQLSIANNALVKVIRQGESMTFEAADESREANAMSGTCASWSTTWWLASPKALRKTQSGWRGLQSCCPRRQIKPGCWLFASGQYRYAFRYQGGNAYADRGHHQRCRPSTCRSDRR